MRKKRGSIGSAPWSRYALIASTILALSARTAWACPPNTQSRPAIGFTFNFTNVGSSTCTPPHLVTSVAGTDNVNGSESPLNATEPAVIAAMRAMHAQGASIIRTVLWYRSGAADDSQEDHLGIWAESNGKLPDAARQKLLQFAQSSAKAGYRQLIVTFGPQGHISPKCREDKVWGACYDHALLADQLSLTEDTARFLRTNAPPPLDILFDIAPETCFDPSLAATRVSAANEEAIDRAVIARWRQAFADSKFIISCGGGPPPRVARGLDSITRLFQQLGVRPAALDIHIYVSDPDQAEAELQSGEKHAEELGVPLMIGETYVDNTSLFTAIHDLEGQGSLPALRAVLAWPKHVGASCGIDSAPPYDLSGLAQSQQCVASH